VLRPEITDDFKETSCRRGCILRVKVNGVKRTTFQSAEIPLSKQQPLHGG